jgi:hypothetical protein
MKIGIERYLSGGQTRYGNLSAGKKQWCNRNLASMSRKRTTVNKQRKKKQKKKEKTKKGKKEQERNESKKRKQKKNRTHKTEAQR